MENMQPGISIIVPVYNVEKYIHQCIDSILGQTFKDYELILVDDGSPDNCPAILDDYAEKDDRIKVIHQENGGVSRARNAGIKVARGKWLYFVDSDDWLVENSIALLYDFAEQTKADIVFTDCVEQYENGKENRVRLYTESFESEDKAFIQNIQRSILCHKFSPFFSAGADNAYPAPWSKLIKTQLIKDNNIEYNPAVKGVYDDGLFTIEVLEHAKKIAYNGNCTYNYRILGGSIVHSFKKDMVSRFELNCFEMDKLIRKYSKDDLFQQAEYCRRIAYYSSFLSSYYYNASNPADKDTRVREIKEAIGRSPWKEAINHAEYRYLENKHRYTLFCLKHNIIAGLKLYSIAKRKLKEKRDCG